MTPQDQAAFSVIYAALKNTKYPNGPFKSHFPEGVPSGDADLLWLCELAYDSRTGIGFAEHWVREFRAIAYCFDFDVSTTPELLPVQSSFRTGFGKGTVQDVLMKRNRAKRKETMNLALI